MAETTATPIAGTQHGGVLRGQYNAGWIPACAGMTNHT
jgi:hypothetical protein